MLDMNPNNPKRNSLTFKDRLRIYELLQSVCVKDEKGTRYEPGWSDQAVAEKLGVTFVNVQNLRAEMFGTLRTRGKAKKDTIEARLKRLEDYVFGNN